MTSHETVMTVRMLIDDNLDWFPTTQQVVDMINIAQIRKIKDYIKEADDRALRPLYSYGFDNNGNQFLADGGLVFDANGNLARVLSPSKCRIFESSSAIPMNGVSATYLDNSLYFNFVTNQLNIPNAFWVTNFSNALGGSNFPRANLYTIQTSWNATTQQLETRLHFTASNNASNVATLLYITYPTLFTYIDNNPNNSIPLQVPNEYHFEIAALAAELINATDVNEMEKASMVDPYTGLTYRESAEL